MQLVYLNQFQFLKTDAESDVHNERLIEIIRELIDLSPSGIKKF